MLEGLQAIAQSVVEWLLLFLKWVAIGIGVLFAVVMTSTISSLPSTPRGKIAGLITSLLISAILGGVYVGMMTRGADFSETERALLTLGGAGIAAVVGLAFSVALHEAPTSTRPKSGQAKTSGLQGKGTKEDPYAGPTAGAHAQQHANRGNRTVYWVNGKGAHLAKTPAKPAQNSTSSRAAPKRPAAGAATATPKRSDKGSRTNRAPANRTSTKDSRGKSGLAARVPEVRPPAPEQSVIQAMHGTALRKALAEAISEHNFNPRSESPRRLRALLMDLAPGSLSEIDLLVDAMTFGVVDQIVQAHDSGRVPQRMLLVSRLEKATYRTPEAAAWTVDAWLHGLGCERGSEDTSG